MRGISHIFSTMRGSVAGVTYLTTPSGQIIGRQRTIPVNPRTSKQTEIRSQFANSAGAWEALSDADRLDWQVYADTLGTGKTGRQLFIANYSLAKYMAVNSSGIMTPDTTPPTDPGVLAISDVAPIAYVGPGTGVSIAWTNPNADSVAALIQISTQQTVARNRFQGPFRSDNLTVQETAGSTSSFYEFDGLVDGYVYFIRIKFVTNDTPHRCSPAYIVRAVAATVAP